MNNMKFAQKKNSQKKVVCFLPHTIHHILDVFRLSAFNHTMPRPFNPNFIMKHQQPQRRKKKQEKFLCSYWHSSTFIHCIEVAIVLLCCLVRSDWPQRCRNMKSFELDYERNFLSPCCCRERDYLEMEGSLLEVFCFITKICWTAFFSIQLTIECIMNWY